MLALTRAPSADMGRAALSFLERRPIDCGRALAQHGAYCRALEGLGCRVVTLAAEPELPDAVFVEDTAVVVEEVAVITRPRLASRRRETASVCAALAPYRRVLSIEAPATLEGGDVLHAGRTLYVGESARTSADGVEQLRGALAPLGYDVRTAPVKGCLHLKSAATWIGRGTLLVNSAWTDAAVFEGLRVVEIDPSEPSAANTVLVRETVLAAASCPRTAARLRREGFDVVAVECDELAKAEGGLSCQSILFDDAPARGRGG